MRTLVRTAVLTAISAVIGMVVPPVILRGFLSGYPDDSFYTLGLGGRLGLVLLTGLLTLSLLVLCVLKTNVLLSTRTSRRMPGKFMMLVFDVMCTIALMYIALYLAPQIYYLYYRVIIEGLPHQVVIGRPDSLWDFFRLTLSWGPETLSYHLQGLTVRTLVVLTILLHMAPTKLGTKSLVHTE